MLDRGSFARKVALAAPIAFLLVLIPPAGSTRAPARSVAIGIGDQSPSMFTDRRWRRLGVAHARYLTPWDVLDHRRERAKLDAWMAAARAAGVRVTMSFKHSHRARRDAREFPTKAQFRAAIVGFRRRYPDVRDFIVWNEANHPLSLSSRRPGRVAKLFDVAVRNCAGCRVIGADVLDIQGMTTWVRAFLRRARFRPRIWGLHNYVDVKNRRSTGTVDLLAATRGKIWFTETGGWILRRKYKDGKVSREFRSSPRKAAGGTRHALRLACLSRRIERVYLYNWQAPRYAPRYMTTWDSGLIGPYGRARPAYELLLRHVRRTGAPVVRCRDGAMSPPRG
jgi:hypothetical protein